MTDKKNITILGVTGSVGQSALQVITNTPEHFNVRAVTAYKNVQKLAESARILNAQCAIISDESQLADLQTLLEGSNIEAKAGQNAITQCTDQENDLVIAAIMGFAGLRPILNALNNGVNVAIANKEPLVAAGPLIIETAKRSDAQILPLDSEHNAIFQVFEKHNKDKIDKLILTASGGPFLDKQKDEVFNASIEQAVKHPNWSMGAKISVDSATMMNKALEIIEAAYLFEMDAQKIDVIIHPQSAIHSIVSYKDGSMLAQMGASDMRTPIAHALAWPNRLEQGGDMLALADTLSHMTFQKPDFDQFPALAHAYMCLERGTVACITFNAANEIAVEEFLQGNIQFGKIMHIIEHALDKIYPKFSSQQPKTVDEIEDFDQTVRQLTKSYIHSKHTA